MKLDYIKCGDSIELLKKINSNSIDMVVTSPPYNAGHHYENYDDNLERKEYEMFISRVLKQAYRVLKNDGRLCINIPFAIKNMITKEVYFISSKVSGMCDKIGFKSFEFICWHKGSSINHFQGNNTAWGSWKSPSCPNFRPMGEAVLVYYKKERKHMGTPYNTDISSEEFKNWTKNMWYFDETNSSVLFSANNAKKAVHPAPFPDDLVERLLKLYSYKEDIILDPFNGIGTTTYIAKKFDRHYIGFDLSSVYCEYAKKRLEDGNK